MKQKIGQSKNIPIDADAVIVARGLASSYLHRASVNAKKLQERDRTKEPEALHDFRVAIRHLRGVLKAYKQAFPDVSKSACTNLRRVAKATNRARDLEVIISWVESTKGSIDSSDHRSWKRIIDQLKEALFIELERVKDERLEMFRSFSHTLAKDLTKTRRSKSKDANESFRKATHDMLVNLISRLKVLVECARRCPDTALLHQMRVTIKRARYMLEPLSDLDDAAEIVNHLKGLQDSLGGIQDMQVLTAFLIERLVYSKESLLTEKDSVDERRIELKLLQIASNDQSKRLRGLNDAWFERDLIPVVVMLEALTSHLASVPVDL